MSFNLVLTGRFARGEVSGQWLKHDSAAPGGTFTLRPLDAAAVADAAAVGVPGSTTYQLRMVSDSGDGAAVEVFPELAKVKLVCEPPRGSPRQSSVSGLVDEVGSGEPRKILGTFFADGEQQQQVRGGARGGTAAAAAVRGGAAEETRRRGDGKEDEDEEEEEEEEEEQETRTRLKRRK
jgi:hypothetical protein